MPNCQIQGWLFESIVLCSKERNAVENLLVWSVLIVTTFDIANSHFLIEFVSST